MTTREELQPLAKQFFKLNSDVKQIFVTEDKHCWYTEMHAIRHCKPDKEYHMFTPKDFKESINDNPKGDGDNLTPKQKLQKEAKDLEIAFEEKTTSAQLGKLIADKKLENLKLEAIELEIDFEDEISFEDLSVLIEAKKEE